MHLLLQSTDIVWTVIGAWFISGEHVPTLRFSCIMGCVGGSVSLSIHINRTLQQPVFVIIINLPSPILLGLCLATLRLAFTKPTRKDNCVGVTVDLFYISPIKLIISSIVAICMVRCILLPLLHSAVARITRTFSATCQLFYQIMCG